MRVLMLTDWTYPCDESFLTEVYAKRFLERGHEVVWVMRPDEETTPSQPVRHEWNDQPVYVLPHSAYDEFRTAATWAQGRISSHPVFDIVADHDVDFVQARNDLAMGVVASGLKRSFGLSYVHRISHLKAESLPHEVADGGIRPTVTAHGKSWLGRLTRRWVVTNADLVLTISDGMSQYLDARGYTNPLVALPMGADETVDPSTLDPPQFGPEVSLPDDVPLLLYVGAMSPMRNLEFLLDAFATVRATQDLRLLLVGGRTDSYRQTLVEYAETAGIGQDVYFESWMDKRAVYRRIAAADVGVSPLPPTTPFRASSPTKVLEYLNLETPAVVTDIPDQQAVVEASGAGYVTEFDRDAYANALEAILGDDRAEMGAAGRAYVQTHRSYAALTDRVLEAYDTYSIG
jgi:glycosyltransferase involved in cell wall biosynthesis